jgi:hypothetical protein
VSASPARASASPTSRLPFLCRLVPPATPRSLQARVALPLPPSAPLHPNPKLSRLSSVASNLACVPQIPPSPPNRAAVRHLQPRRRRCLQHLDWGCPRLRSNPLPPPSSIARRSGMPSSSFQSQCHCRPPPSAPPVDQKGLIRRVRWPSRPAPPAYQKGFNFHVLWSSESRTHSTYPVAGDPPECRRVAEPVPTNTTAYL